MSLTPTLPSAATWSSTRLNPSRLPASWPTPPPLEAHLPFSPPPLSSAPVAGPLRSSTRLTPPALPHDLSVPGPPTFPALAFNTRGPSQEWEGKAAEWSQALSPETKSLGRACAGMAGPSSSPLWTHPYVTPTRSTVMRQAVSHRKSSLLLSLEIVKQMLKAVTRPQSPGGNEALSLSPFHQPHWLPGEAGFL